MTDFSQIIWIRILIIDIKDMGYLKPFQMNNISIQIIKTCFEKSLIGFEPSNVYLKTTFEFMVYKLFYFT